MAETPSRGGTSGGDPLPRSEMQEPNQSGGCDHTNTLPPRRPIPDWSVSCPDCGERVQHDGRGGFVTVREVQERLAKRLHVSLDPEDVAVLREALWHAAARGDVPDDERLRIHDLRDRLAAR